MYYEFLQMNIDRCHKMQAVFLNAKLAWQKQLEQEEDYVKRTMQSWGRKELTGEGLTIKLRSNPPSVLILDEAQIPDEFKRTVQPPPVTTISKVDIKKAIQAGRDVPGADLKLDSVKVVWGNSGGVEVLAKEKE
jgi:hypothetical protein